VPHLAAVWCSVTRACGVVAVACISVVAAACRDDARPATYSRASSASLATSTFADGSLLSQPAETSAAGGTVTVTGTPDGVANGVVGIEHRVEQALPGGASLITFEGDADRLRHRFALAFDSTGSLASVTHAWRSRDESIVGQTDCGGRLACAPMHVSASRRTHTAVFSSLDLLGLDGNSGTASASRLTGSMQ
jgi:hypothetical protein